MKQILLCRDCDTEIGSQEVSTTGKELAAVHSDMLCERCAALQSPLSAEKTVTEQLTDRVADIEIRLAKLEGKV